MSTNFNLNSCYFIYDLFYYVSNNIKTILTKGDKQNSIYLDSLSKVVFSNRELLLDLNKKIGALQNELK